MRMASQPPDQAPGARPTGHFGPVTELYLVDWEDGSDGFDLREKLMGDDYIRLEAITDWRA